MAWDEKKKADVIAAYKEANPTPQNSSEIVKELAEQFEESPNGVRMILISSGNYVKVESTAGSKTSGSTAAKATSDKAPRVSKEAQHAALKAQIERVGGTVDEDIVSKLTGKAAAYFVDLFTKLN